MIPHPSRLTRRRFVSKAAGMIGLSACFPSVLIGAGGKGRGRKTIALLATEVRKHSHAQHFIDRFLEGYGWEGRHYHPEVELAGLFVDQFPSGDLSRDRARRFGVPIFPTIAETLTLGTSKLAVDGVVIIGEHGRYPRNSKGQTLYPRYAWFKEVTRMFEAFGRSVPVFNDKHLSTSWSEAVEMIDDARRLDFAFLAGSSLPVTWRLPALELPLKTRLTESVAVCYGGVDSYDFHGLETAQCMSERRAGGETGVKSVQARRGANIWPVVAQREVTKSLLFAALSRSDSCRAPAGYTSIPPTLEWIEEASPGAIAYFIEHRDGFRTTVFMLNGLVSDFTYAGWLAREGRAVSCEMHLPMPNHISTTADFFNPLIHHIEELVLTRRAAYPAERTLLTTGMTAFAVESLFQKEALIETPEMQVRYRAPAGSHFWRS